MSLAGRHVSLVRGTYRPAGWANVGAMNLVPERVHGSPSTSSRQRRRVVVIGSGYGGLFTAKALKRADVDVTVVSRTTHHLFQPLLYQVATGILSEGEIAPATREILRRQRNARVLLGDVLDVDLARRTVTSACAGRPTVTPYDYLVVAAGARTAYFGHEEYAAHAPGLKTLEDAMELRSRIFGAFERAELASNAEERQRLLTFVVVGAGATGVELTGQISELANRALRKDFRRIDPSQARIVLVEASRSVLSSYADRLGSAARRRLERMGVDVRTDTEVISVDAAGIALRHRHDGSGEVSGVTYRIESACTVWAAGVEASPLADLLHEQTGVELDPAGRVRVGPDLSLPGYPEAFVVGDLMSVDGVPGVAQGAIQSARYVARTIRAESMNRPRPKPFRYHHKGDMAAVSRSSAVVDAFGLRFSGFVAWLMWLALHLFYIVGFRSRVTTLLHWAVSFVGRGRAERTVVERRTVVHRVPAAPAIELDQRREAC